jgi:DNA-binding transcriptional regulator LsrR (DeoR family)
MRSKFVSRAYKPLSAEEKIALAIDRFSRLCKGGNLTPIEELAQKYDRAPAVVSRAIVSAFRAGLVAVRPSVLVEPEIDRNLERELLSRYPRLLDCRIVKSQTLSGDRRILGDDLHTQLGAVAATFVATTAFIQDGDAVAIGGGRAVFSFVRTINHTPLRVEGVTLLSASGDNYASDHAGRINTSLDADAHVNSFSLAFAQRVICKYMSYCLACSTPEAQQQALLSTWVHSDRLFNHKRLKGIMGVGVFAEGHRLYQEANANSATREPRFDPIRSSLQKLRDYCNEAAQGGYIPIADIANNFIFVEPLPTHSLRDDLRRKIIRQIETINNHLIVVGEDTLKRMHSILLIAGTQTKASAIQFILNGSQLPVKYLVTDESTCNHLLTAAASTSARPRSRAAGAGKV